MKQMVTVLVGLLVLANPAESFAAKDWQKVYWAASLGQAVISEDARGSTVRAKPYLLDLRLGRNLFPIVSVEGYLGKSFGDDELRPGNEVGIDYLFGGAASLNLPKIGFLSLFAKMSYTWVKLDSDFELNGLDSSESGLGYEFGIKTYRTRNSVGGLGYRRYLEGSGDSQIESLNLWYKHFFD